MNQSHRKKIAKRLGKLINFEITMVEWDDNRLAWEGSSLYYENRCHDILVQACEGMPYYIELINSCEGAIYKSE